MVRRLGKIRLGPFAMGRRSEGVVVLHPRVPNTNQDRCVRHSRKNLSQAVCITTANHTGSAHGAGHANSDRNDKKKMTNERDRVRFSMTWTVFAHSDFAVRPRGRPFCSREHNRYGDTTKR